MLTAKDVKDKHSIDILMLGANKVKVVDNILVISVESEDIASKVDSFIKVVAPDVSVTYMLEPKIVPETIYGGLGSETGTLGIILGDVGIDLINNTGLSAAHVYALDERNMAYYSVEGYLKCLSDTGVYVTAGNLKTYVPLKPGGTGINKVDAALMKINPEVDYKEWYVKQIGNISGTGNAYSGMEVHKYGKRTGYTEGTVLDTEVDVSVNYGTFYAMFRDVIETTNMTDSGDSGSALISKEDNKLVGLLFAGSSDISLACHIDDVFSELVNSYGEVKDDILNIVDISASKTNPEPNEYIIIYGKFKNNSTERKLYRKFYLIRGGSAYKVASLYVEPNQISESSFSINYPTAGEWITCLKDG
jgi:hypothetical protein